MKKILYWLMLTAAVVMTFTGCEEKDEVVRRIVGEWLYTDEESGQDIEIYISFDVDDTFELFQKIGEGAHRYRTGTYNVDMDYVTGMYSDGTPWASDYILFFADDEMVMKSAHSQGYYAVYRKVRIPAEVREYCYSPDLP